MLTRTTASTGRRTLQRLIAVGIAASVLLAGCAPAGDGTDPAPVEGGTLQVAAAADAQPQFAMANRAGNWSWRRLVLESLVELDKSGVPQPLLATSWSYDETRTVLTIELRDGVTFHNGRDFTADDVVFTLTQAQDPANASQLAGVAKNIVSVTATDELQVEVQLAAPSDSMFDLLDLTPVVDADTWADAADGKQIIGTGPFTWTEWSPGVSLSLAANESYWGEGPQLDGVEISVISDATALQSALKSGTADVAIGMAQSDVQLLASDSAYELAEAGGVFYPFGLDVQQAPFDDPAVRRALGYAIDRDRIAKQIFGGDASGSNLWWTPGSPGYPDALADTYSYDSEEARTQLAAAGAADASINIVYANMPVMKSLFEIVQNNLTEVGLTVTGEALDLPEYDKRQVDGTIGQSFLLLHGMVGFSTATIIDAMPSIRANNPSHFATDEYDALKAAVRGADDASRAGAIEGLSEYMLDEAFNFIIAVAPQYHVHSADVEGLRVVSLGSLVATTAHFEG